MNIDDFIKSTLVQIVRGVEHASRDVDDESDGGRVNPYMPRGRGMAAPIPIEFDIAVTVSESAEAGGGISVMGIGAKAGLATESSSVSRIKFTVPVALPESKNEG